MLSKNVSGFQSICYVICNDIKQRLTETSSSKNKFKLMRLVSCVMTSKELLIIHNGLKHSS